MLYALISPAKRLDFKPQPGIKTTQPALLKDTALLAERTKALSKTQIQKLMEISPALAELNYDRYQAFDPANKTDTKAAIYTFAGDVYMGLVAKTMSKEDVAYAQDHLGILSGLYGLEARIDGLTVEHPDSVRWRPIVTEAGRTLEAATAPGEPGHGIVVEAKGLSKRDVLWRHVLRNAMIPVMTVMGLQFANLLAGTIVIENVFYLPGLGRLIFQSIANRDLIVVRNCVMLLAAMVVIVNFAVDVLYAFIDPRIKVHNL